MAFVIGGPIVLQVVGDTFTDSARITAVIWTGATTAGDTIELRDAKTNALLWTARTPDTNTYLGVNLGPKGLGASNGFRLAMAPVGTKLLVYLMEL